MTCVRHFEIQHMGLIRIRSTLKCVRVGLGARKNKCSQMYGISLKKSKDIIDMTSLMKGKEKLRTIAHIIDRFPVSHESYHELTQAKGGEHLPRSYLIEGVVPNGLTQKSTFVSCLHRCLFIFYSI
jgi:hypothetical protein